MATLVVVDDESLVTDFLVFLLEAEGYKVHAASNGKDAQALVARVQPALVITDLMMPVQSGLELARALRQSTEFATLPLILCSAAPGAVPIHERSLFSAMLSKPYAPSDLIHLVALHVGGDANDVSPADSHR